MRHEASIAESEESNLSTPILPAELWMLWNGRGWVVSADEAPGGETLLVAFSEKRAHAAARHQLNLYDCECIPVRVYPR